MPRPLRIEFQNAWYHVMNRGAGRRPIYKTQEHRQVFLQVLMEACELFGIEIHSYCLMDNHYHLLIKTPRGNLSRAMRHINGVYTQRYNRSTQKDGPLFRGRYKAIIIDRDSYLVQVSRYIHLNPVVAGIAKNPSQWNWSSYHYYLGSKVKPNWMITDEILAILSHKKDPDKYKEYVAAGLDGETKYFYEKINTPVIFGPTTFKEQLLKQLHKTKIKSSMSDFKRTRELPSMNQIEKTIADYCNIDKKTLFKGRRGKINEPRNIAIYAGRTWCAEKLSVLAERYQCSSQSNISNIVTEIKKRMREDKNLNKIIHDIQKAVFKNT